MASEFWRRTAAVALRVVLACVFVLSAVTKLMAIDDFELYVYSYGFLPLDVVFVATRLCIGVELATAALIAAGWWPRFTKLLTLGMLLFFSLFLCYAALIGRQESCQCFGRMVDMPPAVSLLKNAVFIVLTLLYYRLDPVPRALGRGLFLKIARPLVLAAAMVVPFVVSVPDNWMFGDAQQRYDADLLQQTLHEQGLDRGHKLVAFVTPGCPYCRMTRSKLASMAQHKGLDTADIVYLEPSDIGMERFIGVTFGQRPLVLLVDDGKPQTTYHYRNINERQISRFLSR